MTCRKFHLWPVLDFGTLLLSDEKIHKTTQANGLEFFWPIVLYLNLVHSFTGKLGVFTDCLSLSSFSSSHSTNMDLLLDLLLDLHELWCRTALGPVLVFHFPFVFS